MEEIAAIGETFKVKRKELSLSLDDVESSTSIRSSYLLAIEEGRIAQELSPVYVRGFIRQYATFLGLDAEALMRDYPKLFQSGGEKHAFDYGIGTLEMRGAQGGSTKWLPNAMWGAVAIGLLVSAYFLCKAIGLF
jgi:cytoskeletal protein RodZ